MPGFWACAGSAAKKQDLSSGILARPAAIDLGRPSFWTRLIPNAENLNLLYEQADVSFSFKTLLGITGGLAARVRSSHWRFDCRFCVPALALFSGLFPSSGSSAAGGADPPVRRRNA